MSSPPDRAVAPRGSLVTILILGSLTAVVPLSIDMYLPAFGRIAESLHTTTARVAFTLSSHFVGLAVGQLVYGPFLDRFGRKRPLYVGLVLYVVASLACIASTSVESLIVARLFQALGGCAATVAATAMVRDLFSPEASAKVFSQLMLILSVSPLLAPTFGSWIASAWGWQAVFAILIAVVVVLLAVVVVVLPEAHAPDPSVSLDVRAIARTFADVLRDRQFFTYAVAGAFSFAGLFSYLAASPAIFLGTFHLSEQTYGLVFALLSVGMIGGAQVNVLLTRRFGGKQIFAAALHAQLVAAAVFAAGSALHGYGLYAHVVLLFVYISCVGLTYPNAAALALAPFGKSAGSASALLGTLQMGVGALAATTFGVLPLPPGQALGAVFMLTSILGIALLRRA